MKYKEMIGEIDKQRERRINYCVRIQEAFNYKGNNDHEDIPSILVDFENEIKNDILTKDSVLLSREEYEKLAIEYKRWEKLAIEDMLTQERKETAEKILKPLYDACKEDSYGQVVVDFSILENFTKQFGFEIKGK